MSETVGEYEYKKKDLIGHGAFAVVFKGRNKKTSEVVAIKCITKRNLSKSQTLLEKEIKILKEFQHENVVALYYCQETNTSVLLVMEYCNGGDLADYLQAKGTLSEDTIRIFLRQIAAAMKVLHSKGIIHRDLKPQNILLSHSCKGNPRPSDISLKIADFGFARFLHGEMMAATLCGSPMYMAPEVIMSHNYDGKADLWSIGTIVFQCLTGKAPFQASSPQELKNFYQKSKSVVPNIPSGTSNQLKDLLVQLLKRNQKERMDFQDFFSHTFLASGLQGKSSSPVPVPFRSSGACGSLGSSPSSGGRPSSMSPFPGSGLMTPPEPQSRKIRVLTAQDVAVIGSPPQPPVFHNVKTDSSQNSPSSSGNEAEEDFVMVPSNLPSDLSSEKEAYHRKGSSHVEFFGASPPRLSATPPRSGNSPTTQPIPVPTAQIPISTRPSTVPQTIPEERTRQVNEPVPVPRFQTSPSSPTTLPVHTSRRSSTSSEPKTPPGYNSAKRLLSPTSSPQREMPRRVSSSSLGKPPSPVAGHTCRPMSASPQNIRTATPPRGATPPTSLSSTPPRKTHYGSPRGSPLLFPSPASLPTMPTIMGSPTKKLTVGFDTGGPQPVGPGASNMNSPSTPLSMPFATRPKSLRMDTSPTEKHLRRRSFNPDNQTQQIVTKIPLAKSASSGRLSDHLIRAAFGNSNLEPLSTIFGGSQPTGLCIATSPPSPLYSNIIGYTSRSRQNSFQGEGSPTSQGSVVYSTSPSSMEGPITFTAPELPEETLMEPEHNEILEKLNQLFEFVEGIMEVIKSKSSPLAESLYAKQKETFSFDEICTFGDSQRQAEQLVLYLRALQILSNALCLAKDEVKAKRLQPSNAMKTVTQSLNNRYRESLAKCKELKLQGVPKLSASEIADIKAEKLMYDYAIELCQNAALDELFGNPQECMHRYLCARALLMGLSLSVNNDHDRELLVRYQSSVEKRLSYLEKQQASYMVYVAD